MLFTRKSKIPDFDLPRLGNVTLKLLSSAKYLGVILDAKLNWRLNVEERVKKAYLTLYTCRKMVGKTWGLRPKVVLWMYTAIVRPILMYGSLVWWPALERGYKCIKLARVRRSAAVCVTGALRTTPTEALNLLLNILLIDLQARYVPASSAFRLRAMKGWNARPYGHGNILESTDGTKGSVTDFMTTKLDLGRRAEAVFPTRKD